MASAITHFIVGASVGLAVMPTGKWRVAMTTGLWAVAPDLDTWAVAPFHVPRGSLFAHRGFFHSPFFLAIAAFTAAWLVRRGRGWAATGALWACAAITHPLLDMLTDGGPGVLLLFPLNTDRLFFSWRPIRVSPLSILRFFDRAWEILASELPFDAAAAVSGWVVYRLRIGRQNPGG
jgi:inner membrane protein